MNLILLETDDLPADAPEVVLFDRRADHIRSVLRAGVGDKLKVGVLGGRVGTGTVVEITPARVVLNATLTGPPPPPSPHILVLGLPRPKALRRTLLHAVSFGIKRIYIVHCTHVEKSYWQSPFLKPASLRETLTTALEQAGDTILPSCELRTRFKAFVEDELPGLLADRDGLVAAPSAAEICPADTKRPCVVAVGPDRGFTEYEQRALTCAGMEPVSLGTRTLRVETSVPAILSRLA